MSFQCYCMHDFLTTFFNSLLHDMCNFLTHQKQRRCTRFNKIQKAIGIVRYKNCADQRSFLYTTNMEAFGKFVAQSELLLLRTNLIKIYMYNLTTMSAENLVSVKKLYAGCVALTKK